MIAKMSKKGVDVEKAKEPKRVEKSKKVVEAENVEIEKEKRAKCRSSDFS